MKLAPGTPMMNILKVSLTLLVAVLITRCSRPSATILPVADKDNGGLILPGGFEALVFVDSIGETRHIAVADNGDVYAQLQHADDGKGTIAMRDVNQDGKADSFVRFGDYAD